MRPHPYLSFLIAGVVVLGCQLGDNDRVATPPPPPPIDPNSPIATDIQLALFVLEDESARLQIVGRALFPEEHNRLRAIGAARGALRSALATLTGQTAAIRNPDFKMPDPVPSATIAVRRVRDQLQQTAASIQILGRPLTEDEMGQLSALNRATADLDRALEYLGRPASLDLPRLLGPEE